MMRRLYSRHSRTHSLLYFDSSEASSYPRAITTRCDPEWGVHIIKQRGGALALCPRNSWEDRVTKQKGGSSIVIDAGFPFEWRITDPNNIPDILHFESWSKESREKALEILKET